MILGPLLPSIILITLTWIHNTHFLAIKILIYSPLLHGVAVIVHKFLLFIFLNYLFTRILIRLGQIAIFQGGRWRLHDQWLFGFDRDRLFFRCRWTSPIRYLLILNLDSSPFTWRLFDITDDSHSLGVSCTLSGDVVLCCFSFDFFGAIRVHDLEVVASLWFTCLILNDLNRFALLSKFDWYLIL